MNLHVKLILQHVFKGLDKYFDKHRVSATKKIHIIHWSTFCQATSLDTSGLFVRHLKLTKNVVLILRQIMQRDVSLCVERHYIFVSAKRNKFLEKYLLWCGHRSDFH